MINLLKMGGLLGSVLVQPQTPLKWDMSPEEVEDITILDKGHITSCENVSDWLKEQSVWDENKKDEYMNFLNSDTCLKRNEKKYVIKSIHERIFFQELEAKYSQEDDQSDPSFCDTNTMTGSGIGTCHNTGIGGMLTQSQMEHGSTTFIGSSWFNPEYIYPGPIGNKSNHPLMINGVPVRKHGRDSMQVLERGLSHDLTDIFWSNQYIETVYQSEDNLSKFVASYMRNRRLGETISSALSVFVDAFLSNKVGKVTGKITQGLKKAIQLETVSLGRKAILTAQLVGVEKIGSQFSSEISGRIEQTVGSNINQGLKESLREINEIMRGIEIDFNPDEVVRAHHAQSIGEKVFDFIKSTGEIALMVLQPELVSCVIAMEAELKLAPTYTGYSMSSNAKENGLNTWRAYMENKFSVMANMAYHYSNKLSRGVSWRIETTNNLWTTIYIKGGQDNENGWTQLDWISSNSFNSKTFAPYVSLADQGLSSSKVWSWTKDVDTSSRGELVAEDVHKQISSDIDEFHEIQTGGVEYSKHHKYFNVKWYLNVKKPNSELKRFKLGGGMNLFEDDHADDNQDKTGKERFNIEDKGGVYRISAEDKIWITMEFDDGKVRNMLLDNEFTQAFQWLQSNYINTRVDQKTGLRYDPITSKRSIYITFDSIEFDTIRWRTYDDHGWDRTHSDHFKFKHLRINFNFKVYSQNYRYHSTSSAI